MPCDFGDVPVRIVRPLAVAGRLPVILYMHGGGWVLGDAHTHDRLVRELAVGTGAAVVFVEYDRVTGGALPGRDRAGLRGRPLGHARGPRQRARSRPDGGRRRLGRRRHDRRADADGQRSRRRALRPPVAVLPGHRRRDGHRLLRAVRRGLLPDGEGDGVVLGRLRARTSRAGASPTRRRCAPATSSSPSSRPPS